jgi:tryptophan synthase alpha chain
MGTALEKLFETTKKEKSAALISYLPAGYPNQKSSAKVIKAMIDGGVDAVEIGFPYSDPIMDGPVIQAASEEAIKNGAGVEEVFDLLLTTSTSGTPSLIMSYWSPIKKYGVSNFARKVAQIGGIGVITPDLTIEEAQEWQTESTNNSINNIYVVAPSTTDQRLANVTVTCTGFIYAASLMGVTGTRDVLSGNARSLVERIRKVSSTPVAVGLGVSSKSQAEKVAQYADGVIVGFAFIKIFQEFGSGRGGLNKVKQLTHALSEGVRIAS